MKRLGIIIALLLAPATLSAQTVLHSPPLWCEVGGQKVLLSGLQSLTEVQRSIPSCTVTVYNAGSVNVASIFSDALATPTPKANPFSAASNGKIDFYAAASCYDIVTSGGNGSDTFPFPVTYFGVCFGGSGGGGGGGGSGTVQSVGFSAPAGFSVSGSPVTGVGTLALSMPSGWTTQDLLVGDGANSVTRLPKGADQTCLTLVSGAIQWGAGPCVGIPAGTTNQIVKRTDGPNSILGDSSLFDDGSNPVQAPNGLSVMSSGLPRVITNANPATTVLNQLVERNASGLAINATLSSLRALGVAGQNAGVNSAALQVTSVGYGTCVFDGATTINDYAIPSSTTAGLCHDAGATRPLNAEVMGTVTTVNAGAGTTAIVDFFTGDTSQTTPSAIAPCGSSPGPMAYYTAASTLGCDVLMLTDGAGNGTMASLTLGGASAGFLFFTASSQPSFPVANSAYLFAPTSIPTTYALKLPSALGTAGQALVITGVSSNVATMGFSSAAGCPEGTCVVNAPAADQVMVGVHNLINTATGGFQVTDATSTPSDATLTMNVGNSVGQGQLLYSEPGGSIVTSLRFNASGAITLNPKAAGADDGTHGVVVNSSGLYIAGAFTDGNALTLTQGNLAVAGGSLATGNPLLILGSTGVEGVLKTVPASGGGSYTIRSGVTGLTNVITLPNSTGTLANIVGGILTTPNLTLSAITGSVQCLHVDTAGVISGTAGDCATGGSGTVTSIATTAPLGGGTITTTGTLTCATCVVATSPGLGLAHFAGSTQTVTSSLVVNADITAATIDLTTKVTGILPSANGGTANAFFTVSGPATSAKTFTFPNSSATVLTSATAVTVPQGGTNLASGTSGGILAFTGSTTLVSSGVLTANLPVIGGGAGAAPSSGTRSGNTTSFATTSGTLTSTHIAVFDASGNVIDGGAVPSGTISGLTTGFLPKAASSTTLANSLLDDSITTPATLTYSGAGGIVAAALTANTASIGTSGVTGQWCLNGSASGSVCATTTNNGNVWMVNGLIQGQNNRATVSADFTTASSTALQAIPFFPGDLTLPSTTGSQIWSGHCSILYNQTVGAVSDGFGIGASAAPTNIAAWGKVQTAAAVTAYGNLPTLTTTTPTSFVTFTPSAITAVWQADFDFTIDNPAATANTLSLYVSQSTAADLMVIKKGSYCQRF